MNKVLWIGAVCLLIGCKHSNPPAPHEHDASVHPQADAGQDDAAVGGGRAGHSGKGGDGGQGGKGGQGGHAPKAGIGGHVGGAGGQGGSWQLIDAGSEVDSPDAQVDAGSEPRPEQDAGSHHDPTPSDPTPPKPPKPPALDAARFDTWSLLPDVMKYQVSGHAKVGATVTLYNVSSKCSGAELGHDTADDKDFFGVVIAKIPDSRGFDAKVNLNGQTRCDSYKNFFDDVQPWPPIENPSTGPTPPAITSATPYSGLNATQPKLSGMSVAGKLLLFRNTACQGTPEYTQDIAADGSWHQDVSVGSGTTLFYAQTQVADKTSACSSAFSYTSDPNNKVSVTIGMVSTNTSTFHNLTVTGNASTYTELTAFSEKNCSGTQLGYLNDNGGTGGAYTLDLDVPESMKVLQFSIRAKRLITQEEVCVPFTGYFEVGPIDPVVSLRLVTTFGVDNQKEVTSFITPNTPYAYASTTLYQDGACQTPISGMTNGSTTSTEAMWSLTFVVRDENALDMSVLVTDSSGRTRCESFPGALDYTQDSTQVVPTILSDSSTSDQFIAQLGYSNTDGTPASVNAADYSINLSLAADCKPVLNGQPLEVSTVTTLDVAGNMSAPVYGYSIKRSVLPLTKSACKQIR